MSSIDDHHDSTLGEPLAGLSGVPRFVFFIVFRVAQTFAAERADVRAAEFYCRCLDILVFPTNLRLFT